MRLVTEAGFSKPTPLQSKIIPLILKGKDLAVESGDKTGKTAAVLLPLIHKIKKGKSGLKILIITGDMDAARKFHRLYKILSVKKKTKLNAVIIGDDVETRKEYKLLQKEPEIIIGTSKGVIDHIRRGNLSFNLLQALVMDAPLIADDFIQDLYFILSKISHRIQKIFFSPMPINGSDITLLIKRPQVFNKEDWLKNVQPPEHFYYVVKDQEERLDLLYRLICARSLNSLFLFCEKGEDAGALQKYLNEKHFKTGLIDYSQTETEKLEVFNGFQDKKYEIVVIDGKVDLTALTFAEVSAVINFDISQNLQKLLQYIVINAQENIEIISFLQNENIDFGNLQETRQLNTKNGTIPTDEEVLTGIIKNIVSKAKDEDPAEINRLKKLITKNVPLLFRSQFSAYLLKISGNLKTTRRAGVDTSTSTSRLFINIGKNRRIFPKDLIILFTEKTGIPRENIKEIKILDNYSFVEIDNAFAEKAISTVTGTELKGRKIAVNFARKKDQKAPPRNRA